ncbi:unnamed protein product [Urochloa humidicola]
MMTTRSSHWSDIRPELLALVLRSLPSLADRVRLRAVCHPWRYNARLEVLPPPLPWMGLLDGTFLSILGGEIHHMPVLDGASCHGSMDNWLFFVHNDGGCSLMNPFSKATLQLPNLTAIWHHEMRYAYIGHSLVYKLVVPSSVSLTPDSLVVALVTDSYFSGTICICQPYIATVSNKDIKNIVDVAFFDGKLYVLNLDEHLFVLEIGMGHNGNPTISAIRSIVDSIDYPRTLCYRSDDERCAYVFCNYLVESAGKLLYVRRRIGILVPFTDEHVLLARTNSFAVFEVDLAADSCREWRSVSTLRGQALFVGRCSKSLPAVECGVKEDCVYFISDYNKSNPNVDPLRDSGVFNMRSGMITPLLPETVVVQTQGLRPGRRTWFFPTDEAM